MAKVTSEAKVKVYYLPTVASKSAPTVANIAAGTNITPFLPTSGLAEEWTQNNASIPMMDGGHTAEQIGTESAAITLTFTRDEVAADDDAWTLFTRGLQGFLLVSPFGTPVAGSKVRVYPITAHRAVPLAPAENEFQQGKVTLAVHDTPELNATVAA